MGDSMEMEVLGFSAPDSTVRILSKIFESDSAELNGTWSIPLATTAPFMVSTVYNLFMAFGRNILAKFVPLASGNFTYCGSICSSVDDYDLSDQDNSVCERMIISFCSASVTIPAPSYFVKVTQMVSPGEGSSQEKGNLTAFIVDKAWFKIFGYNMNFPAILGNRTKQQAVPTVLDWSLDSNWSCNGSVTTNYAIGDRRNNIRRVQCRCPEGYTGNPYLANGCQEDIDECQQPDMFPCHGACINLPGTHICLPKNSKHVSGLVTIIAISAGLGLLFTLLSVTRITKKIKKQRDKKLREKFFKRNHGLLLRQLISSNENIAEKLKIFSLEELEQATNKFDQNRILGGGGHGTVYKGILSDQCIVAIKKSKIVVQREIDEFINEVVILSQVNHRNVVKLFGCCLETEVPLLVYEFISNGTLAYHLHGNIENPLSWKDRLRIALETARAITYLHSAASISVFHRDIKCANILLTETLIAKVSDFGASRSISIDETGILTAIQGTHGYLDPEYYYTSRLTEKSDVYSFGVILAELLTRMKPVFGSCSSEITSLASYFVSQVIENHLSSILDQQILEEGGEQEAELVARLAEACLGLKGEERPTMRQVETRLEDVQNFIVNFQSIKIGPNLPIYELRGRRKDSDGTRQYSLEKECTQSYEIQDEIWVAYQESPDVN